MALAEVHVQFGVVGGQGEERADSGLPPLQPADYDRSRACCTSHRELHGYLQENVRSPSSTSIDVTAIAQRSDNWWAVGVPEIPSLFTQVQRFDQIDGMARNATRMLGKEIGGVKVEPRLSE